MNEIFIRCMTSALIPANLFYNKKQIRVAFESLTCRIQNPDIPRAGRVEAHGRAAGRGWAGLDADRTVRLGDKRLSYPPRHQRHVV